MNSLETLWKQLGQVSVVHFRSESFSGIGWDGRGTGTVKVSEPDANTIIYEESGQFSKPNGHSMNFRNVFRWAIVDDKLRLEHLRFGTQNPVFLFDLERDENGIWREITPHPCKQDCYVATLQSESNIIFVKWSVNGPTRNEVIDYTYL